MAIVSAVLLVLAFPPIPLVFPAFIALAPLGVFVALRADGIETGGAGASARVTFWHGVIFYAVNVYWIATALSLFTKLAFLGYAVTVVGMAAIGSLAGLALYAMRRATRLPLALLLPLVWVSLEMLFNYLSDVAFPWFPLGLTVAHTPVLAQLADLSGVHGVSFWIAATNGLLADAWLLRTRRSPAAIRLASAIVLGACVATYGVWRMRSTVIRPLAPIGVVQPDIPQEEKWQEENRGQIVGILSSLTRDLMRGSDPALIVWPEVALPGFIIEHPAWRDTLRALSDAPDTPIIFGVLDVEFFPGGAYAYYNAAMLADTAGRIDAQPAYRKGFLVPIVERVPFLDPAWFGDLKYFGGYGRGGPSLFRLAFGEVGVLICYESIFPQRSRSYRRSGAELILNITNDAWFGQTFAPYQHEAHLALRAIENRVGVVRAGNNGISEYIDPVGRRHGATRLGERTQRTYNAGTTDVMTLFVRVGDWVGVLAVVTTLLVLAWDFGRRRRRR
ncbi:MAG: apolipoprotein N-acyltransferase [Gemmatimonadaceae bacterium]